MATLDLSPALEVSTDSPSMRNMPPFMIHFSVATLSQNSWEISQKIFTKIRLGRWHTPPIYIIYTYILLLLVLYIYIYYITYVYILYYICTIIINYYFVLYILLHTYYIIIYHILYNLYINIYIYIDYILYLVYYISYIIYIYLLYCIVYTYFCFHDFRWGFSESNCWRNHKSHPSFSSLTLDTLQETCDVWCSKQPRNMAATSYSELV